MVYTLRFFFKCSLFHNSNVFGSCIIHILYTGVLKLKNNPGAKTLIKEFICQISQSQEQAAKKLQGYD